MLLNLRGVILKKYIDLEDMVNTNCSNVLDVIQKNENISRKQITELTGLSWGGMTKIVNKLLENEYITEKKTENSSKSGRTPSLISINNERNFVVGLDINKTGFKATVMNLSGEILKNYSTPVSFKTKTEMLNTILSFTENIFNDFPPGIIIAIGIAMQGVVDSKKGISVKFPDIPDWQNIPLKDILSEKFNVNVFIEHDPDCMLYSHMAEEASKNLILFRIDKSIGMAVSVGGKLLKGKGILEIAHNIVIPNGKKCACEQAGCLESYISPCLANDKINLQKVEELLLPLSVTIKNMTNIFNSDTVILMGDLMLYHKKFEDKLFFELNKLNCTAKIIFSNHSSCAVSGAALIAIHKSINSLVI